MVNYIGRNKSEHFWDGKETGRRDETVQKRPKMSPKEPTPFAEYLLFELHSGFFP